MKEDMFICTINSMFQNLEEEAVRRWIGFAKDCVEREQYVDFEPVSDKVTEAERWMDSLLAGLLLVNQKYGERVVRQMIMLAVEPDPLCLYPCEMLQVAELLQRGATQKEINESFAKEEIDGEPPFFPKLSDILGGSESGMDIDWIIAGI